MSKNLVEFRPKGRNRIKSIFVPNSFRCKNTAIHASVAFHWVKTAYEQSVPMNRSSAYFYFDAIATIAIEGKTLPVD